MIKPKILLVIDKPDWAYDHIASFIVEHLSDKYSFYKDYQIQQPTSWKSKILFAIFIAKKLTKRKVYNGKYDLVVYLWWKSRLLLPCINANKRVVGIFTEGFPPGGSKELEGFTIEEFYQEILSPCDGLVAGNRNIQKFYEKEGMPVYYATGAVNLDLFRFNRQDRNDNELRVCWTGNPHRKFKGFFDYVKPAVELAQIKHPYIKFVTRFKGPINTLPDFYQGVDVMVNASIGDAGPGFIIDAGACGVPTISTNVGFASELIIDHENGILVERNIKALANKIIEVYEDRALLRKMSLNISKDVHAHWGHQSRAKYWDKVFQDVLKQK